MAISANILSFGERRWCSGIIIEIVRTFRFIRKSLLFCIRCPLDLLLFAIRLLFFVNFDYFVSAGFPFAFAKYFFDIVVENHLFFHKQISDLIVLF